MNPRPVPGQLVLVTRTATTGEGGWRASWPPEMDACVGQIGWVTTDYANYGLSVQFPNCTWSLPPFVLEPISAGPVERLERSWS